MSLQQQEAKQNKTSQFKDNKRDRGDDFKSLEPETKTDFGLKTFNADNTTKNSMSGKHDFDIMLGGETVSAA